MEIQGRGCGRMVWRLDRKFTSAKAMGGQEQKACPLGLGAAGDTLGG